MTDSWFRIQLNDQPVGYERMTAIRLASLKRSTGAAQATTAQPAMLRRRRDTRMHAAGLSSSLSLSALLETEETEDGFLSRWSLIRTGESGIRTERSGRWIPDRNVCEVSEKNQATSRVYRLRLPDQPRSALLTDWIPKLTASAGQPFRASVLFPETAAAVDMLIDLKSQRSESENADYSRVEFWPADNPGFRTVATFDSDGGLLRSEQPLADKTLSIIRSDRISALNALPDELLNKELIALYPVTISGRNPETVPVIGPDTRSIAASNSGKFVHLKIRRRSAIPLQIPEGDFQSVKVISPDEVIVTLTNPLDAVTETSPVRPASSHADMYSEFLKTTRLASTNDLLVQRISRQSTGAATNSLSHCRQMTRYVFGHMKLTPFRSEMLPANDAAESMAGDCTEYATLLAAIMRCRQIPARVAAGLAYTENSSAAFAHMWTEAMIDGRWIPFDAALGPVGAGMPHVKLLDASLADDDPPGISHFFTVLDLLKNSTIEILTEMPEQ